MAYFTNPLGNFGSAGTTWAAQSASKVVLASFGQVGSVYGLGIDQRTGDLYAGAFYKRYSGLARGPGAIFQVGQDKSVHLWASLSAGTDAHPTSDDSGEWFGTAPAHRDMSWDKVGKTGLGSVKVDPDNQNV